MATDNPRQDTRFMDLALELATSAGHAGEVPVGAIVVADGEIIGRGQNRSITARDATAHAEILALRDACMTVGNYRLVSATLYVTLEPCVMCAGAMVHARIRQLVYGCPDPKGGAAGSLYQIPTDTRLNHQIAVRGGVRDRKCRELLQGFFEERRS